MKQLRYSFALPLTMLLLLAGCGGGPESQNVWDSYDTRHPVGDEVPNYNAYPIDNDSYYAAPDCSIMDSPSCGGD